MPVPQWLQKYQADRNREVQTRTGSYYDPRRAVWIDTGSGRPQPEPGLLGPVAGTGSQFRTGPVPAGEGRVTLGPTTAAESAAQAEMTPWELFQAQMAQMGAVLPGSLGGAGSDPSKLTFTRDVNVRAGGDAERQAREGGPARYFSIAENEAAAQRAAWDRDAEPPGPGLVADETPIVTPPAAAPPTSPPNPDTGQGPIPPFTFTPPGGGLLWNVATGNPFADESRRLQTQGPTLIDDLGDRTGRVGGGFPGTWRRQFGPPGGGQVVSRVPARPVGPENQYTGPGTIRGGFNRPANLYEGPGGQGRPGYQPQWVGAPPSQPPINRGLWQRAGGERGRLDLPQAVAAIDRVLGAPGRAAESGARALGGLPWEDVGMAAAMSALGPGGPLIPTALRGLGLMGNTRSAVGDAAQTGWDALQDWHRGQPGGPMQRPQPGGPRGTWQRNR